MSLDPGRAPPVDKNDNLSRNVYCVLGLPIDVVDLPTALRRIRLAATENSPFLLSTPNLNFLVNSRTDSDFRESVQVSDLCPADGMPIVWIARLLGIPIKDRVAGSDIFDALRSDTSVFPPLRVFLFGGEKGVADKVATKLNAEQGGMECVGALTAGFGTVEEMSSDENIVMINRSDAQFLAVSLGAKKGQAWLLHNHDALEVPVRVHLGAVINFQAGTVKRAPQAFRKIGLEWLWRIKEEPYLWRRYAQDGLILIGSLSRQVLPLASVNLWHRLKSRLRPNSLRVLETERDDVITVRLSGSATSENLAPAQACFGNVIGAGKAVVLDLSDLRFADSRVLGLILMLRKQLGANRVDFRLMGIRGRIARLLRWNGLEWLLAESLAMQSSGKVSSKFEPVRARVPSQTSR